MILHIATFTWVDKVTPSDVEGLTADLRAMAKQIPELRTYHCGESLRLRPGADFGVAAVVDDEAGLTAYLDSDPHKAVYTKWLSWMIDTRQAAQLALPADGASL